MAANNRKFEDVPAVRDRVPLIIRLVGPSSSGKTYTGLELATGIQRVVGGEIYGIDTESGRMKHYSEYFKFRHIPFKAPHGPQDYEAAIDHCASKGAKIILIDQLTSEHDGDGGVMDQVEAFLDEKAGSDWKKRLRLGRMAHIKPKAARKALNRRIVDLSGDVGGYIIFILCYRAQKKNQQVKAKAKTPAAQPAPDAEEESGSFIDMGWQPITTSNLQYDVTVGFLFPPRANGIPDLNPEAEAGKEVVKIPRQFQGWFQEGKPLTADHGERLAKWAAGADKKPDAKKGPATLADLRERIAGYEAKLGKELFFSVLGKHGAESVDAINSESLAGEIGAELKELAGKK